MSGERFLRFIDLSTPLAIAFIAGMFAAFAIDAAFPVARGHWMIGAFFAPLGAVRAYKWQRELTRKVV